MLFTRFKYIYLLIAFLFAIIPEPKAQEITWSNNGPYGGRIYALAVDPIDTAIVYAGTYDHGVFKSYNSGASWMEMSNGLPIKPDSALDSHGAESWFSMNYYPIKRICINPLAPANVLVGTEGGGIYRSSNGGQEWSPSNIGLPSSAKVTAIIQTPLDTSIVFAGLGYPTGGAYKSTDGGKSWALMDDAPHGNTYHINTMVAHPDSEGVIYVGFSSAGEPGIWCGLWKSQDSGDTWEVLIDDLRPNYLYIDHNNPQRMFTVFHTGFDEYLLHISTDGGHSWKLLTPPDSWETLTIALNSYKNPANLFASTWEEFFMSSDQGSTWTDAFRGMVRDSWGFLDLAVNLRNPEVIYVCNNTGVYRSNDGGASVHLKIDGMINTYINEVVVHPSDCYKVYAGCWLNGMWKSNDGGVNWKSINQGANFGEVNAIVVDPQHPDTLYRGGDCIHRSYDGGENWERIGDGYVTSILIRPDSTNIILCALYPSTLLKSTDRGQTWRSVISFSPGTVKINTIVVNPREPRTAYLGAVGSEHDGLHKTTDGGETWNKISEPGLILCLAIDPADPGTLYVGTTSGLKRSTDGGITFSPINNGLLSLWIRDVVIDHQNPAIVYASTGDRGVFKSKNYGDEWAPLDAGLGDPKTSSLAISPSTRDVLYVGTYGSGVWKAQGLLTPVDSAQTSNIIPEEYKLNCAYPNPFNTSVTITYFIPQRSDVNLKIMNIRGQLAKRLMSSSVHESGQHRVQWDGLNESGVSVATGLYFVVLQTGQCIRSMKVVLLR